MPDVITIDLTPTFSGLLPVMLAAHANMERKLSATNCDGFDENWCSVHDQPYDDDQADLDLATGRTIKPKCEYWTALSGAAQHSWRSDLLADMEANEATFRQMADLADRLGRIAKAYEAAGSPRGGPAAEFFVTFRKELGIR